MNHTTIINTLGYIVEQAEKNEICPNQIQDLRHLFEFDSIWTKEEIEELDWRTLVHGWFGIYEEKVFAEAHRGL